MDGFGPVIISVLFVGYGRLPAFNITNLFRVICCVLVLSMVRTFLKDQARLDMYLKGSAGTMAR